MSRLFWPLGIVAAFGIGVVAGTSVGRAPSVGVDDGRLPAASGRSEPQAQARPDQPRDGSGRAAGLHERPSAAAMSLWVMPTMGRQATADERLASSVDGAAASNGRPQGARAATPPPTVEAALERFYRYLDESDGARGRWWQGREAIEDLKAMGAAGIEALLRVLSNADSLDERRAAASLLGALQDKRALPLLQQVMDEEPDVLLRRAAAQALRRIQSPDTIPTLETLMARPGEDRFVRLSAAIGLANLGTPGGVIGLAQIFEEANADGRGRDFAFRAMAALNDERPLPFMRGLLTSPIELSYRLQAIRFVALQGDQQSLPLLRLVMDSPAEQRSIREAAAQAYAAIANR
jgi:HEAT repeat protein